MMTKRYGRVLRNACLVESRAQARDVLSAPATVRSPYYFSLPEWVGVLSGVSELE